MHIAHTRTSYLVEDTHPHQSIQRMQMQREIEDARQDTMRLQCKDAHEDTMHCDAYEGRASLSSGTPSVTHVHAVSFFLLRYSLINSDTLSYSLILFGLKLFDKRFVNIVITLW